MNNADKYLIINDYVTACDYRFLLEKINNSIIKKKILSIAPITTHTLVHSTQKGRLRNALKSFTFLVPDSQWVKRSIYFLYGKRIKKRIYGPELMVKVCEFAERKGHRIFLYGTTYNTLSQLNSALEKKFPRLKIGGFLASKFSQLTMVEKAELIEAIKKSNASILFIALGEPLQEIFTYDLIYKKPALKIPITVVTVGAAFDFISGVKPQAPIWVQNLGFEWLFRLLTEPRRLSKRYLIYGPLFILLILKQKGEILLNSTYNIVVKNKIRS
ncbi:MAG: WecB/TagA/CpsF family glycosyltransferase [Candidatus Levybacteria bacterium]|nr:WecB/TagA/CpsF family glycosyltransferase [Candidatus Levybacteria bacterium]